MITHIFNISCQILQLLHYFIVITYLKRSIQIDEWMCYELDMWAKTTWCNNSVHQVTCRQQHSMECYAGHDWYHTKNIRVANDQNAIIGCILNKHCLWHWRLMKYSKMCVNTNDESNLCWACIIKVFASLGKTQHHLVLCCLGVITVHPNGVTTPRLLCILMINMPQYIPKYFHTQNVPLASICRYYNMTFIERFYSA
jgi:hypothetical protein